MLNSKSKYFLVIITFQCASCLDCNFLHPFHPNRESVRCMWTKNALSEILQNTTILDYRKSPNKRPKAYCA